MNNNGQFTSLLIINQFGSSYPRRFAELAFVHNHKAAGTTILHILRRSFGIHHCEVRNIGGRNGFSARGYLDLRKRYPCLYSISGHSIHLYADLENACPNVRYWTFMRDPIERCASHFQFARDVHNKDITFESWVNKDYNCNYQTKKLVGKSGSVEDAVRVLDEKTISVGPQEHLDESIVMFRQWADHRRMNIWCRRKRVAPRNVTKIKLLSNDDNMKSIMAANSPSDDDSPNPTSTITPSIPSSGRVG